MQSTVIAPLHINHKTQQTMRTVFPTHSDVCHQYAHNDTPARTSSGNVFTDDGITLYSYGYHFALAHKGEFNGEKVFFLNSRTYSVSTTRHQSYTRQATRGVRRQMWTPYPMNPFSAKALAYYVPEILADIASAGRRRAAHLRGSDLDSATRGAEAFLTYFKAKECNLTWSAVYSELNSNTKKEITGPRKFKKFITAVAAGEFDGALESAEERRKIAARKEREELKRRRAAYKVRLAKWKSGEIDFAQTSPDGYDHLRTVSRSVDGEAKTVVQTTQNVLISLSDALALYTLWTDAKNPEKELSFAHLIGRRLQGLKYGEFRITACNPDYIQIGCHRIRYTEARDFVKSLPA